LIKIIKLEKYLLKQLVEVLDGVKNTKLSFPGVGIKKI